VQLPLKVAAATSSLSGGVSLDHQNSLFTVYHHSRLHSHTILVPKCTLSGGVDSSLVAAVVHRVFPEEQQSLAVLGRSAALPKSQLLLAREVASHIGIQLHEVSSCLSTVFAVAMR